MDQFGIEKDQNNVAVGYRENKINFPPSYKYIDGTDILNYRNGKNQSYTDRILYGGTQEHKMNQLNYETISEMLWSDHKPVIAQFEIDFRGMDWSQNYQDNEATAHCCCF